MKKIKQTLKVVLPFLLAGGAGLSLNYQLDRQREQEQQRIQRVQKNYIFNPSLIEEGSRVAVNYDKNEKSFLERGGDQLASIIENAPHSDDYTLARNVAIPNYSEGKVIAITRNEADGTNTPNSVYVEFPISVTKVSEKFREFLDDSFPKDHSQYAKTGSYDLFQVPPSSQGGVVARYDPEELLVEKQSN